MPAHWEGPVTVDCNAAAVSPSADSETSGTFFEEKDASAAPERATPREPRFKQKDEPSDVVLAIDPLAVTTVLPPAPCPAPAPAPSQTTQTLQTESLIAPAGASPPPPPVGQDSVGTDAPSTSGTRFGAPGSDPVLTDQVIARRIGSSTLELLRGEHAVLHV